MKERAFAFIEEHRDDALRLWQEIVDMESGSENKKGVDAVAARLRQILDAAGAATKIIEMERAGNMLVAEIGAGRPGPGVAFIGHTDTVFPEGTVANRPFTIKDGMAYGPGVLDMKGGIVAIVCAIQALNAAGYEQRPLKVILAGDEEVAHKDSDTAERIMEEVRGVGAAFNCETGFPDDGIVVGRKGSAMFALEVKGIAAHAGNEPEKGRSAILEMAHKVIDIQGLTDWNAGITFNVGIIQGGTVVNAVPDSAKIEAEVRYREPAQLPGIHERIRMVASKTYLDGTSTTVAMKPAIAAMQTTEGVKRLFEVVAKSYSECGWGTPYQKFTGGGSDSAYSVMAGVPTVCAMGVKGGRNHSPQEFAVVESLFERAKLLVACTLNLDLP